MEWVEAEFVDGVSVADEGSGADALLGLYDPDDATQPRRRQQVRLLRLHPTLSQPGKDLGEEEEGT